jgi:hypothetical protein
VRRDSDCASATSRSPPWLTRSGLPRKKLKAIDNLGRNRSIPYNQAGTTVSFTGILVAQVVSPETGDKACVKVLSRRDALDPGLTPALRSSQDSCAALGTSPSDSRSFPGVPGGGQSRVSEAGERGALHCRGRGNEGWDVPYHCGHARRSILQPGTRHEMKRGETTTPNGLIGGMEMEPRGRHLRVTPCP